MEASELTESSVLDLLLDPERRRALRAALRREQGTRLPLNNRYGDVAFAVADAPRLGEAVHALLEEPSRNDHDLLDPLLLNPHTPEEALWAAFRQGRGITPLGHRRGPRALLEALAEEHRYSEAITSLVLFYYANEDDDAAFRAFVERHRGDSMLQWNLARSREIPERKRALIADLIDPHR